MTNFTLRRIKAVEGKQEFEELVINGVGQLESFNDQLADQYKSEFDTLIAYMDFIANLKSLPDSKFKDITPKSELIREYEFKSKHLRFYAIKKDNGKIVMLCGYKNVQDKNVRAFRALKKKYLESLNIIK